MKKRNLAIGAGVVLFTVIAIGAASESEDTGSAGSTSSSATTPAAKKQADPEPAAEPATKTEAPKPKPKPKVTVSQAQALAAAQGYVEMMPMSKQGLIDQLASEYGNEFPRKDALWAVERVKVSWKAEAVEAAKGYLEMDMGMSRQGLIDQLSAEYGEQFTRAQAVYAVSKVGL